MHQIAPCFQNSDGEHAPAPLPLTNSQPLFRSYCYGHRYFFFFFFTYILVKYTLNAPNFIIFSKFSGGACPRTSPK